MAGLAQYKQALNTAIEQAKQEQNTSDEESVAGKMKTCSDKYAKQLGSALQGIMGMLAGMMQGNKCEQETAGTSDEQVPGTVADKCILPENASLPECICKLNPRTVGCASAFAQSESGVGGQVSGGLTDKANVNPTDKSTGALNTGNGMQHGELASDGSGSPGAPGGGSAGLGSSNVGQGGGAGGGEGGGKGLNTNILGGTAGGGGSGAGGWNGGGDKLRQYLPGGAKDPSRSVAGQQAWTKEVTGEGGKSNWEKVKDRYRDNKNTLLNAP
jgi:hypothetical protein